MKAMKYITYFWTTILLTINIGWCTDKTEAQFLKAVSRLEAGYWSNNYVSLFCQ